MKLEEIKEILNAEVIVGEDELGREIKIAGAADLMSDALALLGEGGALLLTGLVTPQVIRTAEMLDLSAIVFVRGKMPPQETIELAKKLNIPLLRTKYPMYEACGKLYSAGLKGKKVDGVL
ncbi:MAG: DRTGG domain-containing protein [Dictyoglomaceae bacterium]